MEHNVLGDELQIVMTVLDGQPEQHKKVIRMRFMEHMEVNEIADTLGLSRSYTSELIGSAIYSVKKRVAELCKST